MTSAVTVEEMNQRYKPLPTVPEKDLPPLKNTPEPFAGTVLHPGFEAHTWVRFPFVENPGSFGFDRRGRLFVAEANRFWRGAPDLRGANELIRGDFQSRTVADRAKLYETFASRFTPTFFTDTADRIIRLEDRDGNGAADFRTVFSDRFHDPLDGIGFSVLPEDDAVYFTCIPNLWKLKDTDNDGVAESEQKLVEGFGTRVSFIGHDLHGLTRGPDGRLYFSVGDRGYHVTTPDGKVFEGNGRGAIFRCESDGSGFEVFCVGLRNPQELAFDESGNLFTFDNTGDIGDLARMVYALERSDSGWDMGHQSANHYVNALDWEDFHPETSMWVAEKMFETFNEDQPQWVYPPASHVARGPSGVTWLTGETLPQDLRGKFLLANYRGAAQGCNVLSIGIQAHGAGYRATSEDAVVQGVGVTDVELGYDGNIYLCDFGGGWSINTNGAIQVLRPKDADQRKLGAALGKIFAQGLHHEPTAKLLEHLQSADRRLRQLAQFELVQRGEKETLAALAADISKPAPTRLHGIWGLDQLGRKGVAVAGALLPLARDHDPEIRANTARTLGSVRAAQGREVLLSMLGDASPRVQSLAAIALSRVVKKGDSQAIDAVYEMAARNSTGGAIDRVLRHAALAALDQFGDIPSATARVKAARREVRLLALLYLRRQESAEAAAFLMDSDPLIRSEAVRAIYDTAAADGPAGDAVAALGKEAATFPVTVQRRIVAANYRRGTAEHAKQLLAIAGDHSIPLSTRAAALHALRLWEKQITTDPVHGNYRPVPKSDRPMNRLGEILDAELRGLFSGDLPPQLTSLALKLADQTGVRLDEKTLRGFAINMKLPDEVRVAALESLVRHASANAAPLVASLLDDARPAVAAAALKHGFALKIETITAHAAHAIESGSLEKARAGIEGLASLQPERILEWWKNRENKRLRRELWLDVYLALQASTNGSLQALSTEYAATDANAVHRLSETGGVVQRGEKVFRNQGACLQCHKMGTDGGIQGPSLTLVGERLAPSKLVESLVNPNAEISEGYGLAAITLTDGNLLMGRIASQTKEELKVISVDGKSNKVARSNVATIAPPVSAMPPLGLSLPPRDLRDLVAYLATRTSARATGGKDASSHGQDEKIAK